MHLLCEIKEFKKKYKQRKDKGKKRNINVKNKSTSITNNYLKARTFRNVTSPLIDTAREIRHWTSLGSTLNRKSSSTNKSRNLRNQIGLVKDVKSLLR